MQRRAESRNGGQSTDVLVTDPAFSRPLALCIAGEEGPVVFLDIGIVMPSRLEHSCDVAIEPCISIIAAALLYEGKEVTRQLEIERVLAGLEELVVVNAALPPVPRLFSEDIPLLVERMVLRAPEDATGVGILGLQKTIDDPVITTKRRRVVVPVHRHCQGIGSQRAKIRLMPP